MCEAGEKFSRRAMQGKKSYQVEEALERLKKYCVYQDRCHQEVAMQLRRLGMHEDARAHIISELIRHEFLNEERFSRSFSRGKFSQKGWGRLRIVRELRARDISEFNIRLGLSEIDEETYLEQFGRQAERALAATEGLAEPERRRKLWNYLEYRGWESELISGLIEQTF